MASMKSSSVSSTSSRYHSYDTRSSVSSHHSDVSTIDPNPKKKLSTLKRLVGSSRPATSSNNSSSRAITKVKSSDPPKLDQNFTSLVKKFMEKKGKPKALDPAKLAIPADFIADDLKKNMKKGSNFSVLQHKLFPKPSDCKETRKLTDVKPNTRTLAMVLRSERELLNQNKEYETEIKELQQLLSQKNREVQNLKDLCIEQREEIRALKSTKLFPDAKTSYLHDLLEKQGSELKQASEVIPALQEQVTSLTDQLQFLAKGLAEVKGDKNSMRLFHDGSISTPRTPIYNQEAANSMEFSSGDTMIAGSPDDMILNDMNPCLTPYYARRKGQQGYDEVVGYGFGDMPYSLVEQNMCKSNECGFPFRKPNPQRLF
ncbi:uncharacterized protein LOC18438766 isoform X1 [Amborella trichopoda]|uniref:uncharacterized protein LOC18438766 isoform X1 n=1 Tax=Amborella trichopoda TaxID=13333 RepID=UPI0009BEB043|nr:uncharacterized protein LOC18438766 isoform X1 [Amborella trichopoda]|eukprot:XP_020525792.1 uncharacterized protein LOC18438766 isoform X1 [Amborella trichopoda]